ncbi:hypothetical protein [Sandaracinus amylolyticus]|nr:hypothetical protein [Sandaracinus amylolyticus]UJR84942.1 Hypothetical protein I5071_70210 [Sandaracinus amylolyticus]
MSADPAGDWARVRLAQTMLGASAIFCVACALGMLADPYAAIAPTFE